MKGPERFAPVRWTMLCAGAETVGVTVAASAGLLADRAFPAPRTPDATALAILVVVVGGLVEGVVLGSLQASGLRRWLPAFSPRSWILITTLVAGLGWASATVPTQLAQADNLAEPPRVVVIVGGLAIGALMGSVLGAAQATVLHGVIPHPWRWIWISTIAWTPAVGIIFVGAALPRADWSVPLTLGVAAITGGSAGVVLGAVSGGFWPLLQEHVHRTIA